MTARVAALDAGAAGGALRRCPLLQVAVLVHDGRRSSPTSRGGTWPHRADSCGRPRGRRGRGGREYRVLPGGGFDDLLMPAGRLPVAGTASRTMPVPRRHTFRRVPTDESVCHIFALQPPIANMPTVAEDGLPIPPPEMIGLVAGGMQADGWFESGRLCGHMDPGDAPAQCAWTSGAWGGRCSTLVAAVAG